MGNCVNFMNAVLFCVLYNLASFILSVEEKSQNTLELL